MRGRGVEGTCMGRVLLALADPMQGWQPTRDGPPPTTSLLCPGMFVPLHPGRALTLFGDREGEKRPPCSVLEAGEPLPVQRAPGRRAPTCAVYSGQESPNLCSVLQAGEPQPMQRAPGGRRAPTCLVCSGQGSPNLCSVLQAAGEPQPVQCALGRRAPT